MAYLEDDSEKIRRSKKMMLWFGMISMVMSFAGLTSAYIVSKSRPDWINDYQIPTAFYYSTLFVLLSSFTMYGARIYVKRENHSSGMLLLLISWVLGAMFVVSQLLGFSDFMAQHYFFTGPESTITT